MKRLAFLPVAFVLLLLFTAAAKAQLPLILAPLFELTAGHPDVLSLLFCLFLVVFIAFTWAWSARSSHG